MPFDFKMVYKNLAELSYLFLLYKGFELETRNLGKIYAELFRVCAVHTCLQYIFL